MAAKDLLKDRLELAYRTIKEYGSSAISISMSDTEIIRMMDMIDMAEAPAEKRDYEKGYMAGFEGGYQRAIVDVLKKLKGMKWYGGDGQKHADEMPGDHS